MIKRIKDKLRFIWQTSFLGKIHKDKDALRWGIIGTGYMADIFSKAIIGSKKNILYAVASRSMDKAVRFGKSHGAIKSYGSYEDLVEDKDIDVVYIATPVQCHYDNIKLCILANKNVLCEKPLTLDLREAEDLFHLAKERNLFLMEGMWTLSLPTMKKAKKWIEDGLIGTSQFIRADLNKRVEDRHIQKHSGVLNDYGVYGLAFMQSFLGGKATVSAIMMKQHNLFPTDWCIIFKNDNSVGCLNIMSNMNASSKAVIIGDKGSIEWDSPFNRTNTVSLYNQAGILLDRYCTEYSYDGFEYQLNEVYECIKSDSGESKNVPSSVTIDCIRTIQFLNDENH